MANDRNRYRRLRDRYDAHRDNGHATILLMMSDMQWLLEIVESNKGDVDSPNEQLYNESFQ